MKPVLQFLATGDLQADEFKQFATILPNGMNSRLANIIKVIQFAKKECLRRGIKRLLLNGDIFEKSDFISAAVFVAVYEAIEDLHAAGIDVVISIGNHDIAYVSKDKRIHCLVPFKKISQVIETPTVVWGHVMVCPWQSSPKKLIDSIQPLGSNKPFALVLHCGVQGAVTGPKAYLVRNPIKLVDIKSDMFDLVLLSDYHTTQWLSKNTFYMGSPLQHNFGEIHNPSIWEISLYDKRRETGKRFKAVPIYTNMPRFVRVTLRSREGLSKRNMESLSGNYVHIVTQTSDISDKEIDRLARQYRFQYRMGHDNLERARLSDLKAWDPKEIISRYVDGQHLKRTTSKRLTILGNQLFKGDV